MLRSTKAKENITSQIKIMILLGRHNNVCKFEKYFEAEEFIYILMEFC